jgi:hypothetical protein
MPRTVQQLAEEAARLAPEDFSEFCRRLAEKRAQLGLSLDLAEELLRQEDLALSQHALAEDWEGVPDDWEATECPSPEAT